MTNHMVTKRRTFLNQVAAVGAALLAAGLAAAAPSKGRTPLSAAQTETLAAWCETLVPGAPAAGVGAFVNAQLSKPTGDALLMIRYLDWTAPLASFYTSGVDALDGASRRAHGQPFAKLSGDDCSQLLAR